MIFPSPMTRAKFHELSEAIGFSPQRQSALFHHYYSQLGECVVASQGTTHYPGGACLSRSGVYEHGINPKSEPSTLEEANKVLRYWGAFESNAHREFNKLRDEMIEAPSSSDEDPRFDQLTKLRDKYRDAQAKREQAQQAADDLNPRIVKSNPEHDHQIEEWNATCKANQEANLDRVKRIRI
jgi:hypothetical protein